MADVFFGFPFSKKLVAVNAADVSLDQKNPLLDVDRKFQLYET